MKILIAYFAYSCSPRDGPRNRVHTVIKSAASVSIQIQSRNWRILISVFRVLTLNRPTVSPTATAAPLTTAASLNPPNLNQIYNYPCAETRNASQIHTNTSALRVCVAPKMSKESIEDWVPRSLGQSGQENFGFNHWNGLVHCQQDVRKTSTKISQTAIDVATLAWFFVN